MLWPNKFSDLEANRKVFHDFAYKDSTNSLHWHQNTMGTIFVTKNSTKHVKTAAIFWPKKLTKT